MATSREQPDVLGVRVFSATRARERDALGEAVTDWIHAYPQYRLEWSAVRQSSDTEFHCLTIVVFYRYPATAG